ncbi:MAG: DUF1501 domain-containing protein [Pseudomonadota bacterium]
MLHRRTILAAGIAFTALAGSRTIAPALAQQVRGRKLLFVIQRGAADGLAELAPVGDRHFADLRRAYVKEAESGHALDDLFRLHPSLPNMAKLYDGGQAAFVHATASVYRDRSHFDGQNVLESGGDAPYKVKTGWLNRLITLLETDSADKAPSAIALSSDIPLALRGPGRASSYTPSSLPSPDGDFLDRLNRLYGDSPDLAAALQSANETRDMAGNSGPVGRRDGRAAGALMARLMGGRSGASVAMVETEGWDLHANGQFRMRVNLKYLDDMLDGFRSGMAGEWDNTLVVIATEFGRSAAINGTNGTDHGTGGVMMLLGGTVNGGKVHADWPGLGKSQLLDGRDLRPTISQESAISGAVAAHFALDPARVQQMLFTHMRGQPVYPGLVRG